MPTLHFAKVLTQAVPKVDKHRLIEDIKKDNKILAQLDEKADLTDDDYVCSQDSYASSQESYYSSQYSQSSEEFCDTYSQSDNSSSTASEHVDTYQDKSQYDLALEIAKDLCKTTAERWLVANIFAEMYQVKKEIVYMKLL
ncbi:hypothetical protein DXG01_000269 [Tephrocybe rancida]|nr:hypothetical protein DXG01_000269 [Tephrocybe rancida]